MPLQVINGPTIAAGEALSDAIDITSGDLVRLTMPADWVEALLTFQISSDGEFFNDLYNYHGEEVTIPVKPGAGMILPRDFFVGVGFIRFRSGTADHEIPQPEERAFSVALMQGQSLQPTTKPGVTATGAKPSRSRTAHRRAPRKTAKVRRKHR